MTILVTGGAGYIGSQMAYQLVDSGERVVVLDNLSTGFDWAIPPGVPAVAGDVGDARLLDALVAEHGVSAIIHFAASVVVPESVADPLRYYRNNTVNSRSLIEAAVRGGVEHFIFSSTAAVYGEPDRVPIAEDAPTRPMSPYGSSKLMAEIILRDAARVRTGQSTRGATHLIKVAAETALGLRPKLEIYGTDYPTPDGTCIRDYIHVGDLAAAHSDALRYLRNGGESLTLNCGYGHGFSVLEVIDAVKRAAGVDFRVEFAARRPGDPARIVAAADRARALLGWQPQFGELSTIVAHALAWERQRMALARRQAHAG